MFQVFSQGFPTYLHMYVKVYNSISFDVWIDWGENQEKYRKLQSDDLKSNPWILCKHT